MIQLNQIQVAAPCHESWENMAGDDRARFCDRCKLNVYNLAEMSHDEIDQLIREKEGRVCGRIYRRADGTMITRNCPVGVLAMRKRMLTLLAWGVGLITGAVVIQNHPPTSAYAALTTSSKPPHTLSDRWHAIVEVFNPHASKKLNNVVTLGLILTPEIQNRDSTTPESGL